MFLKNFVRLGLVAYVFLNVADWVQTYTLLRANDEAVETNPLAAICLRSCGWSGLAVYKAVAVLVFGAAVYVLARRRPPVAACVVTLGVAVVLSVNVYSHTLIASDKLTAEQREQKRRWMEETDNAPPEPDDVTEDGAGEPVSPEPIDASSVMRAEEGSPEAPPAEPAVTIRSNAEACGEQSRDSVPPVPDHPSR